MKFNFLRGRQMVVHDPRLKGKPPAAYNVWTVTLGESASHIFDHIRQTAKGGPHGSDKLDALHFMAHGYPGGMQIGRDGFSWSTVANNDTFKMLNGCIRGSIVFFSCQVGAEQATQSLQYGLTFGSAVSNYANCKVIMCKVNQIYHYYESGVNMPLDFGEFEGPVYLYRPNIEGAQMLNVGKSSVNLEALIFNAN